jgi:hypothetical protein
MGANQRQCAWWVWGAGLRRFPGSPAVAGQSLVARLDDNCPRVRDQRLQGQTATSANALSKKMQPSPSNTHHSKRRTQTPPQRWTQASPTVGKHPATSRRRRARARFRREVTAERIAQRPVQLVIWPAALLLQAHPDIVKALEAIIRATTILVTRDMTQLRQYCAELVATPKGHQCTRIVRRDLPRSRPQHGQSRKLLCVSGGDGVERVHERVEI